MALGKSRVKAESNVRKMEVIILLDNKKKHAESAGILATVTNDVHDSLRRQFCAHEIKVDVYIEPKLPKRLEVKKR